MQPPPHPIRDDQALVMHNLREEQVLTILSELLVTRTEICRCATCRSDMAVYALNRCSPRYVGRGFGETMTRVETDSDQDRAQVAAQVARAIKAISARPRHEGKRD